MPKRKIKSRFDYNIDPKTKKEKGCEYSDGENCNLPKYKRCSDCLRFADGSKFCWLKV